MSTQVTDRPRTFVEAEQVLAKALPGYESRPQQQALATFVEKTLTEGGTALAEAGCGCGKSLGAMIPAILSGKRTVVATATIALMEQYAQKDVPFLAEHLGVPFTWALLKGRSNYWCHAKATQADAVRVPNLDAMRAELEENPEHSGDREHFAVGPSKEEFSHVSISSAECPGRRECPFGEICFAERAKAKAAASQVVVTNTAMLMTDLKVREMTGGYGSMLGDFDALILDEAHELEEIATSQLEETFRPGSLTKLLKEVVNYATMQGTMIKSETRLDDCLSAVLEVLPTPEKDKTRLGLSFFVDNQDPFIEMIEALNQLYDEVLAVTVIRDEKKANARRAILTTRILNMKKRFTTLVTAAETDLVRWVEIEQNPRQRTSTKVLHFAPINVAPFLTEWLWSRTTAVLMSATLSVGGDFTFIQERLGLTEATTLNVGTPFDYNTQARLFVPGPKMPSPKDRSGWMSYTGAVTQELITAAGGGALLLFTSRSAMTAAYDGLGSRLREQGFTVLGQGLTGTNKEIAKIFAEDTHSVLFALKSFFTGVDIPGDSCRLVIIDKLPFPVPSEPVFQARADEIKRNGGNDFAGMAVPMMTLTLVQGFGRLIRTRSDKGVVAILDSRLSSTAWGRRIVGSMPDCPATSELADIQAFFSKSEVPS